MRDEKKSTGLPNDAKLVCLMDFVAYLSYMSLAPIFPHEAKSRGVSVPMIGTIYAMYSVTNTLTVPIVGLYLASYGRRKWVFTGFLMLFISMVAFTLMKMIPKQQTGMFIAVSMAGRLV